MNTDQRHHQNKSSSAGILINRDLKAGNLFFKKGKKKSEDSRRYDLQNKARLMQSQAAKRLRHKTFVTNPHRYILHKLYQVYHRHQSTDLFRFLLA